jgi:hypothetical protein
MSHGASISSYGCMPPFTAEVACEVVCEISREQEWQPGTIANFIPSQLEREAQLVMDRLLRDCLTRKSASE